MVWTEVEKLQEIIELVTKARYVAIDTEFFYGLDLTTPSFLTPEEFYSRYVQHQKNQYIAQLGLTVAIPGASSLEVGSPEVQAMNKACEDLGLPHLFVSDFQRYSFNTMVPDVTKFYFDTLNFLHTSGFSVDNWISTAIDVSTHPLSAVKECTSFWRKLFDAIDTVHGANGFADSHPVDFSLFRGFNPQSKSKALSEEMIQKITKQAKQDAYGLCNNFLASSAQALESSDKGKGKGGRRGMVSTLGFGFDMVGSIYETTVQVHFRDLFEYIPAFLSALQEEDASFNSKKLLKYYLTLTPTTGCPQAVLPNYAQHLADDVEQLTGYPAADIIKEIEAAPVTTYHNSSVLNPKLTFDLQVWSTREEAQLHTRDVLKRIKDGLYGLRALTDAIVKYNVPLVIFAGCADLYLFLSSVYGKYYLSTYDQFRMLLSKTFPRCFELKVFLDLPPIIGHLKANFSLGARSLSQLFGITTYSLREFPSEADNPTAHDAGYDSLMTALSFEWILGHFLCITGIVQPNAEMKGLYKTTNLGKTRTLSQQCLKSFINYSWSKIYVYHSAFPYPMQFGASPESAVDTSREGLTQYVLYPVKDISMVVKGASELSSYLKAKYPHVTTHYFIDRGHDHGRLYIPTTHPGAKEILDGVLAAEKNGVMYEHANPEIAEIHTLQFAQKTFLDGRK